MPQATWNFQRLKALLSSNSKSLAVVALIVAVIYSLKKPSKPRSKPEPLPQKDKNKRGHINTEFFFRLWRLIRIVIPSWKSREFISLCALSALLVLRTMVSISLSGVKGKIVKAIVKKDSTRFIESVFPT